MVGTEDLLPLLHDLTTIIHWLARRQARSLVKTPSLSTVCVPSWIILTSNWAREGKPLKCILLAAQRNQFVRSIWSPIHSPDSMRFVRTRRCTLKKNLLTSRLGDDESLQCRAKDIDRPSHVNMIYSAAYHTSVVGKCLNIASCSGS